MSLLPLMLNDSWGYFRPSQLLDQHFGVGLDLDDLLTTPITRAMLRCPAGYYRPWKTDAAKGDAGSIIVADKDKFQVNLDVQQFKPNEITVKATGNNMITVEGKHEEKQDEHGFISRHFVRKYVLPEGHDINGVISNLSSDGVLSITAPRIDKANEQHRTIPIQQTGAPSKPIEEKKKTEKK